MTGPLDGIRVVELGVWVAGPGAAGILADWGADVVKIEPPAGDPARSFRRMLGGDLDVQPAVRARQPRQAQHRRRPRDRARGVDDRRRAPRRTPTSSSPTSGPRRSSASASTPTTLRARHPRLVYALITGYGLDGPDADRAAYDIAAFWARAGIAGRCARPGGPLPFQRGGMGDHSAAMTAAPRCQRRPGRRASARAGPARVDLAPAPGRLHHRLRREHRPACWGRTLAIGTRRRWTARRVNNYTAGDGALVLDRRARGRPALAGAGPSGRPARVARPTPASPTAARRAATCRA